MIKKIVSWLAPFFRSRAEIALSQELETEDQYLGLLAADWDLGVNQPKRLKSVKKALATWLQWKNRVYDVNHQLERILDDLESHRLQPFENITITRWYTVSSQVRSGELAYIGPVFTGLVSARIIMWEANIVDLIRKTAGELLVLENKSPAGHYVAVIRYSHNDWGSLNGFVWFDLYLYEKKE